MDKTLAIRDRSNLKDEAAGHVRSLIFTGRLRPRQKIDQDLIAAMLGVSKQPVREAMIQLESEGLVQMVARRGAFVAALTRDDIIDHFLIFGVVSAFAARRSIEHLSSQDLDNLDDIVAQMADADAAAQRDLNHRFHRVLNKRAGSKRLLSVISHLANSIPEGLLSQDSEWWTQAHHDHDTIVGALRERDGDAVVVAVETHLRHSGEATVRALEHAGFWLDVDEEQPKPPAPRPSGRSTPRGRLGLPVAE